jgi:hypothetical protein
VGGWGTEEVVLHASDGAIYWNWLRNGRALLYVIHDISLALAFHPNC